MLYVVNGNRETTSGIGWCLRSASLPVGRVFVSISLKINFANTLFGNRLLNWPKLLGIYADGFYSIFVPECVPYIIPHMFQ